VIGPPRQDGALPGRRFFIVVPANAGTHGNKCPLLRGVSKEGNEHCLSRLRHGVWVPAFAGTTNERFEFQTAIEAVIASEAKQSIAQRKGRMDCFVAEPVIGPAERPDPLAPRNDGCVWLLGMTSHSRGVFRPRFGLLVPPSSNRGRGDAGRPMRPIAACAMDAVDRNTRVSQVTPEITRHSPRDGLRLIPRSPR